jgi:hypothetical protein
MQLEPERPRPRRRLGAVTAGLGLALALALAGCGGPGEADRKVASLGGTGGAGQDGGGSGSATAGKDPEQAALDFARCMRRHGVDMPDPTGDGMVFRKGSGQGPDPESSEFQAADRACGHHLDAPGKPGTSEEQP